MNEKSMSTRTSYLQGLTLKELLEHPDLQNAPQTADDKESFQDEQNDPLAAFLGPNLWEKTYDFNLEYMNLDDFLTESGISTDAVTQLDSSSNDDNCCSSLPIPSPGSRPPNDLLNSTASSSESLHDLPAGLDLTPEKICSKVDFNVSKLDLVLATDTGKNGKDGRPFDPQNHHFSEEELKPQPLIKKSKKIFVPDELKNEKYWLHRKKNNMAAKRSREARRLKENQIVLRAGYLEKASKILREELTRFQKEAQSTWKENEQLKLENKELKTLLARYGSENSLRIVTG